MGLLFKDIITIRRKNIPLLFCVFFAILLGVYFFRTQTFFYYDQARDAYQAFSIWHDHHFKILGPGTDINNLYSGVLWYYFLAILYAVGNASPTIATFLFFILAILTIPFCWYLSSLLFKNKTIASTATILYSFSALFQWATHWLSNPVFSLLITPLLLIFLWKLINFPTKKAAVFTGLLFGLLVESDLAFIIFLITIPLYAIFFRFRINLYNLILFVVSFLFGISTYFLAEIKFHERGIHSILLFFNSGNHVSFSLSSTLTGLYDKFQAFLLYTSFPIPKIAILVFIILFIIVIRKIDAQEKKAVIFLLIWLVNIIIFHLFSTGISNGLFMLIPSILPFVILCSFLYVSFFKKLTPIIIVLIIIYQVITLFLWAQNSIIPYTVQKGMTLMQEEKLIDYSYRAVNFQPFTINTITNPLYINTTWAYLYNMYGAKKYGYVPFWDGKDQNGNLGSLPFTTKPTTYRYLIVESQVGIQSVFVTESIKEENRRSKIVVIKNFGDIMIQQRKMRE